MKVHDTVYSTVVTFEREVDAEIALQLKDVLSAIDAPINGRLIMDMKASSYLSANGICVLLNDYAKNNENYQLEFRNVSNNIRQLLDTAGLGDLIVR